MKRNISPMTLGTVQLGMNYGIANEGGKPSLEKSFSILEEALSGGITSLDTARAYGNSEEVIGAFIKQSGRKDLQITTKIPRYKGEGSLESYVLDSVEGSLERLGIAKLSSVMLHAAGDLLEYGDRVVLALESLVRRGYVEKVGVSVYTAEEIHALLQYDSLQVTQIPMSIFDQRLIACGAVDALAKRGVEIYVRSVFLQGLFFLDSAKVTDPILLAQAVPAIEKLRRIALREGMTVAQLAVGFLRDLEGVTSLVLGADEPSHVKQNLSYFSTPPLSEGLMAELKREFSAVNVPEIMKVLSRPKA